MLSLSVKITVRQWKALHTVVACGGFGPAAELLNLSRSSISYTVSKMQDLLGYPLLRKQGRKAVLTEEGSALLEKSMTLITAAIELEEAAKQLRRDKTMLRNQHRVVNDHGIHKNSDEINEPGILL